MQKQWESLQPSTYRLFTSDTDYTNFSCTTSGGNSVEHIHNTVHNTVGNFGHMTDPAASAFDPVFWLHHSNVDRLLAMWQVINPQSYLVPTINTVGSYGEPRGFMATADSNLLPFHSSNGTQFWTSNTIRSTRTFGYTYPELVDWNITPEAILSNVRASVNRFYGSAPINVTAPKRGPLYRRRAPSNDLRGEANNIGGILGSNGLERQWTIIVEVQRFAYPNPFSIDFFDGPPPEDPSDWPTASNLIGSHAQFITTNADSMHPSGLPKVLSHGEVSMTHSLLRHAQKGALGNLEPDSVIPFMIKALSWRARDMTGCELQLTTLADLSIAVGSQVVQPAKVINRFPTYGEMEIHEAITVGKVGGYGDVHKPNDGCNFESSSLPKDNVG
jgi:tyrosinase